MNTKAVARAKPVESKPVAVKSGQMVTVADDFEQFAGVGFEEARAKTDYAIPFLTVLQSLSPGVQEGLEGYKPGMILNTVTKELSETLTVIPVHYTHTYVEWVPRNAGGGFRGEFHPDEREVEFNSLVDRKTGKATLPNGNELTDTRNFYVLIGHDDGGVSPALISMTSSQIAVAKNLCSLLNKKRRGQSGNLYTPAMAVNLLTLKTRMKSNAKGKWYVWDFELLGDNSAREQIEQGLSFHDQISAGKVVIDRAAEQQADLESEQAEESDDL